MKYLNKLEKIYLTIYVILMSVTVILGAIGTLLNIQNMNFIMTTGAFLLIDLILLIIMFIYVVISVIKEDWTLTENKNKTAIGILFIAFVIYLITGKRKGKHKRWT